jgi:primase-polymerase (primpol)-like protein
VVWRYVVRGYGDKKKKTKVLFNPATGKPADSTNPDTWSTYADAEFTKAVGRYDGIGFVFSKPHNVVCTRTGEFIRRIEIEDPYTGIDLDDSVDDAGRLEPWASPIVARFNTRTEISPSRHGVKMFVRGKLPRIGEEKCRARTGKIELYDRARYFTVTGMLYPGSTADIAEAQEELVKFYNELFPRPKPKLSRSAPIGHLVNLSDAEIVRRAGKAANGGKFRSLFFDGSTAGHTSGSEADLALCNLLAFWTGPDPDRIDRIFRASALCDEKWESRADYRASTINLALETRTDFYDPHRLSAVDRIALSQVGPPDDE